MFACFCSPDSTASHKVARYRESDIRACDACGLGFTDPPPGDVPYEDEDFHLATKSSPDARSAWKDYCYQWAYRSTLGLVKKALPAGGKVMDIGCGEGTFLRILNEAGYETIGLEPSRSAVARARENGLNVSAGRLDDPVQFEKADLVLMSHVLEHIADVPAALRRGSAIAPGGYLLLVQTNYRGWVPRLYPRRWYAWMPNQHFWHFTPRSLAACAAKCGYTPVACVYSGLVHEKWKLRVLSQLARLVPGAGDQFHLLLRHTPA